MHYENCPYEKRIEQLEKEMKERMQQDAVQETILEIINNRFDKLETKIDNIDGELHNGLIPKKASQWFYSSVGKWVLGLIGTNIITILALLYKIFQG